MGRTRTLDWDDWLASPAGQYMLKWEQAQLDHAVVDVFGYLAAQFGCAALHALQENRIACQLFVQHAPLMVPTTSATDNNKLLSASQTPPIVTPSTAELAPQTAETTHQPNQAETPPSSVAHSILSCNFEELPFASQSLDLVVLPHGLEFATDPHQVLREVERVLVPEGRIILTGFNPLSLWGARHTLSRYVGSPFLPHMPQHLGVSRVKDWLKLLGLEVVDCQQGGYVPPFRNAQWLDNCNWMDAAGARWWPIFGALYCITAVKRVRGMRLIGPAWRNARVAPALAPSASPQTHHQTVHHEVTPSSPLK